MEMARVAVWSTVAVIAAAILVSGPLVGAVAFTSPDDGAGIDDGVGLAIGSNSTDDGTAGTVDGSAELSVTSAPTEDIRFEQTRFGAGRFFLHVPDVVLDVDSVDGYVVVTYELRVPDLGYMHVTPLFLDESDANGQVTLSVGREPVTRTEFSEDSYDGIVTIHVQEGRERRTIFEQNVTIDVVRQ